LAKKNRLEAEMSRRMDRLWGANARPTRGPKPALTLERIVLKAIEIADRDGLAALTMQKVAKRLRVTTMALYRYVDGKSELMDAMVEAALGSPPVLDGIPGWRCRLALLARENLRIYERHPWALHALIASPPFGPNQLAWFEAGLQALSGTRASPTETIAIISLVDDHVRGSAQLLLALAATPHFVESYARALERAGSDERYPGITALAAAGAFADTGDTAWNPFEFGLERVLDGVEAFIEAQRSRTGDTRRRQPEG
jgi:AcrR family transcriptional regulator